MQLSPGRSHKGQLHRQLACVCIVLITAMLLAISPSLCRADTPLVTVFESAEVPAHLGVTVEPLFSNSTGYNPVRVIMRSMVNNPVRTLGVPVVPGPAPRDRNITFTIYSHDFTSGWENSPPVTGTLLIPKGAMQAETIINIPVFRSPINGVFPNWYARSISLSERGKAFRDSPYTSSPTSNFGWAGGRGVANNASTSFLFVHSSVPDAATRQLIREQLGRPNGPTDPNTQNIPAIDRLLQHWYPTIIGLTAARTSDWQMINSLKEVTPISLLPPNELPDEWAQLSSRGIIIISQNDLVTLSKTHPTKAKAIFHWLRTGTGLIVYGTQANFKGIPELEKSLGLPPLEVVNTRTPNALFDRSKWEPLSLTLEHAEISEDLSTRRKSIPQVSTSQGSNTTEEPSVTQDTKAEDGTTLFDARVRAVGLGLLVAIDSDDPFTNSIPTNLLSSLSTSPAPLLPMPGAVPGSPGGLPVPVAPMPVPIVMSESKLTDQWQLVFDNIGSHRLKWEFRTDMNLTYSCDFFWNMLIPGVGAAPVMSFMVLVTFFAIAIGPFNFAWVRKRKQAVLLLITVPLAGLVTTAFLFAYALTKDGVVTRSRIRSFTHLDQKAKSATSWSRQTYYAAIAPSQGYEFSDKEVVFPIIGNNGRRYSYYSEMDNFAVEFKQGKQLLSRDFLKSRTYSQLLVIHSGESDSQLIVTPPKEGQAPKATNRLAGHIQLLIIRDHEGKYHQAENIPLGSTQDLKALDKDIPLKAFKDALFDNQLLLPEGLNTDNLNGGLFGNNYRYYGYSGANLGGENIGQAVLSSYGSSDDAKMPKAYHTGRLQNGEFIALVAGPQDVPQGIANTQERESFHCITGNW
ncbi:MAG: hypothetical protein ACO1RA_07400 [Planctomycetaceae bacterium]